MIRIFLLGLLALGIGRAEPLAIRVIAANLTSDNKQSYSPDNGNHSNPEGAGARILKALKPDIVMIQEFNTTPFASGLRNKSGLTSFAKIQAASLILPRGEG